MVYIFAYDFGYYDVRYDSAQLLQLEACSSLEGGSLRNQTSPDAKNIFWILKS